MLFPFNQLWPALLLQSSVPVLLRQVQQPPASLSCESVLVISLMVRRGGRGTSKGRYTLPCKSNVSTLPARNGQKIKVIWGQKIFKCVNPDTPISYLRVLLLHKALTFHRHHFPGALLLLSIEVLDLMLNFSWFWPSSCQRGPLAFTLSFSL